MRTHLAAGLAWARLARLHSCAAVPCFAMLHTCDSIISRAVGSGFIAHGSRIHCTKVYQTRIALREETVVCKGAEARLSSELLDRESRHASACCKVSDMRDLQGPQQSVSPSDCRGFCLQRFFLADVRFGPHILLLLRTAAAALLLCSWLFSVGRGRW